MTTLTGRLDLYQVGWLYGLLGDECPPHDAPEEVWRAHATSRLAHFGLEHLRLISVRPPSVILDTLPDILPEGLSIEDPGLALLHDGDPIVLPTCCADENNLDEWRSMLLEAGESWKMLWIGHPWVSWKRDGDDICLSDYHESTDGAEPDVKWKLPVSELCEAVRRAEGRSAAAATGEA